MATLTGTSTSESAHTISTPPASLKLQTVTAIHDTELNEEAEGAIRYTRFPNDRHLPIYVQPALLQTGRSYEWTNEMESVRIQDLWRWRFASAVRMENITRPYDYLASQPGKDIRKQLLTACNFWLDIDETALITIERSVSMLHNASLLYVDNARSMEV